MENESEDNSTPSKILEKILECSIWLEERTAELYFKIARRIDSRNIALLLKIIAHQSKSHAEMLNWILETLLGERKPRQQDCLKITGEVGRLTTDKIKTIEEKEELGRGELCNLIKELEFIENGIGEETYSRILLPLIKTTMKQSYPETTTIKTAEEIIETIIHEEELHEKLVNHIGKLTGCDARANPSS